MAEVILSILQTLMGTASKLPVTQWPRFEGDRGYALVTRPLDLDDLLALATEEKSPKVI